MKKIFVLLLIICQFSLRAQTYVNEHPWHYNVGSFTSQSGSGYGGHGITINTKIPSKNEHKTTVYIKGFDGKRTIGIQLSWYYNGSEFYNISASSTGGWVPELTLNNDANEIRIGINQPLSDGEINFEIDAFTDNNNNPNWFTDWNIENSSISGREVNYINRFYDVLTQNLYADGTVSGAYGYFNNNVGIGTNDLRGPFQVAANNRTYYANRPIDGATWDASQFGSSTPINGYVVLHPLVSGSTADIEPYIAGRITASSINNPDNIRVGTEINSASVPNNNHASMIDYNQAGVTRLVILTYAGTQYVALEISHIKSITDITFTGYAKDESFFFVSGKALSGRGGTWVNDVNIQSVQAYPTTSLDPITVTGPLKLKNFLNTTNNKVLSTDANGNVQLITYTPYWQPHNNTTTNPNTIGFNGTVYVGANPTTTAITESTYKLVVGGTIGATKVKVTQGGWADYVFSRDYKLMPLSQLDKFIKTYGHLPEVPKTDEVEKEGVDIGSTQVILLKKIEELTLHLIEQNTKLEKQNKKIELLESKVNEMKKKQ